MTVHGQTGLQVEPGDVDHLARAMQRLWDHPDEARRMGAMGKRRVESQYRVDDHLDAIEEVYKSLVS